MRFSIFTNIETILKSVRDILSGRNLHDNNIVDVSPLNIDSLNLDAMADKLGATLSTIK